MIDASPRDSDSSPDRLLYVRALLRFVEAADDSVDKLARRSSQPEELYRDAGRGRLSAPPARDGRDPAVVQDYRALGETAMAARFDQATRRYMVASASEYTTGICSAASGSRVAPIESGRR